MTTLERFAVADQTSIRERNRAVVLEAIRAASPTSRADVAKKVALTKPTVSAIVDDLIREGVVREMGVEHEPGVRGRPPIRIAYVARSQQVVGVNIGVEHVEVAVVDGLGSEIASRREPTARGGPDLVLRQVAECIRSTLADAGTGDEELLAVCACVPGRVDAATGVCQWAPNLGWRDVEVGPPIEEQFGVPVIVHNDAQAALMAEMAEGVAAGREDVVLLYAGAGIGAAVLLDGEIYRGASGAVGEMGHAPIKGEDARCRCGRRGCLETVASRPAIERAARAAELSGSRRRSPGLEEIGRMAVAGDARASEVLRTAGSHLGTAAATLMTILNPQMLVFGGSLAAGGPVLFDALVATARVETSDHAWATCEVVQSSLGPTAELRGAVLAALRLVTGPSMAHEGSGR